MASPLLRALRQGTVDRQIHLCGFLRPGLHEILDGSGLLDSMIVGQPKGAIGPFIEGKRLRQDSFDAVILLPNSFRLALTSVLSRVPNRIGYGRDGRSWMLTHALPCSQPGGWKEPIPAPEYYLRLASAFGLQRDQLLDKRLSLLATEEQAQRGNAILQNVGIGEHDSFVLLNPGGNRDDKRWSADRFAKLGNELAGSHGLRVVVNGSPNERELVSTICNMMDQPTTKPVNLVEQGITLGSLKQICKRARLMVTNDTGTRHIAVGMNFDSVNTLNIQPTGVITLFGPTVPEWTTLQYDHEIELSTGGKPVNDITFEAVLQACEQLLST